MYGCEWDDETEKVNGYHQYGYDGEDLLVLELKTMTWIAPKPQAVLSKQKWENSGNRAHWRNYLTQECVDWLKKYWNYGKSSLMRTSIITSPDVVSQTQHATAHFCQKKTRVTLNSNKDTLCSLLFTVRLSLCLFHFHFFALYCFDTQSKHEVIAIPDS